MRLYDDSTKADLDLKDRKILARLVLESRTPFSTLRKDCMLSRDGVKYRIDRLRKRGLIQAFIPQINFRALGYHDFHLFLVIDESDRKKKEQFIRSLSEKPFVREVMEYSDRFDLEVVILARDAEEFDKLAMGLTQDMVIEKHKMQVIKGYISMQLPKGFYKEAKVPGPRMYRDHIEAKVDDADIRILEQLSKDSRSSGYYLGKASGLTAEAVSYRIRRLERLGIIRNFTCIVDLSKLGYSWYTLLLKARKWDELMEKKMHAFVENNDYILKSVKLLGTWDFLFYVLADSHRHYHDTVNSIRQAFPVFSEHESLLGYREHTYKSFPEIYK